MFRIVIELDIYDESNWIGIDYENRFNEFDCEIDLM